MFDVSTTDRWLYGRALGYVAVGAASLLIPLYVLTPSIRVGTPSMCPEETLTALSLRIVRIASGGIWQYNGVRSGFRPSC